MIRFGFKEYKTEFPNWSKHHKSLGLHVKRIYSDGKEILPKDETLKKLVQENEEILKSKQVNLYDWKKQKEKKATDYYLPLENLDYIHADLEHYGVGAMNTEQTTCIRLTFLLEQDRFILDYSYDSSGSYATSFYGLMDGMNSIEDIIEEILEKETSFQEVGITKSNEADYDIIVVSDIGEVMDVSVEKRELLESLVAVEVYKFEQKIN